MDHFSIIHQDKTIDTKPIMLDNVTVTLQRLSEDIIGQYTKRRKALYELQTSKRYSTMVNRYCCQCDQKIENDGKPGKRVCPNCRSKLLCKCAECGFESKSYGQVFYHVQNKCGARISVCHACGMECLSIIKLRAHLLICDGTEYLRCKHCIFKTTQRAVFYEHISRHMATLDNNASQDWPNLPKLNDNAIVVGTTAADTEKFMTISINNVNFGKVSGLKKKNRSEYHKLIMKAKLEAKQLIGRFCPKCMKPIPKKAVEKNIRNNCVTCGTELRYRCLKCKRKYVCKSGIVNHVRGKCGPIPLVYGCLLCSHTSHSKYLLHRHTINCHQSGDTTKECSKCGNILKNEHSLNSHLNYCGKPPRYACDHCPYRTVFKTSIRKHLKGHYWDLFPPSSEAGISDKSTNSGNSSKNQKIKYGKMLKRYCKRCKETVKQAVCPSCEAKATVYCKKCNSEFKIYGRALYHVQDKCAARISQCPKCGIEYPSIIRLRFHLPNCGRRILGCLYCNFTTKNKTSLDNHTKKHLTNIINNQRKDIQGTATEHMNNPLIPSINNVDLSIVKRERYTRLNNLTPISEEEFDTVTEGTNNLVIPSIQNVDSGVVKTEKHIRLHNQTPISEAEFEAFVTAIQTPNIKEELDLGTTEFSDIEGTELMSAKEVCDDFDDQLVPKVPIKLKMDYVYMYYQEC